MKKLIYLIFVLFVIACNEKETGITEISNDSLIYAITDNADYEIGKYVLSPTKIVCDSLKKNGFEDLIFVYYPRKFIDRKGNKYILEEFGDSVYIPSSLVIPLPDSQLVSKNDYVLTWWQKGTGMQRAIVLSNEPTATPLVYYVDNQYYFYYDENDPNLWIDTLEKGSFLKIEDKLMPGRSCCVSSEYLSTFYTIINVLGTKILALSWSGDLKIFNENQVELVPMDTKFSANDSVFVPYLGTYTYGKVKSTFKDIGKMKVNILFIDTTMQINANIFDSFKIE